MPLEPELDKVISLTQCLRDIVFSNLVVKLSCLIPSSVINLQSFKQQEATQKDLAQTLTNTHTTLKMSLSKKTPNYQKQKNKPKDRNSKHGPVVINTSQMFFFYFKYLIPDNRLTVMGSLAQIWPCSDFDGAGLHTRSGPHPS